MMLRVRKTRPSASASETRSMLQSLVRPGRRVEVQAPRGSDALADATAHGEPLRSVDAVDELVVDGPALPLEQFVQHPIAVARPVAGELAEVLAQLRILDRHALVAAGRTRQLDDAACAALAHLEVRLEKTRSLAACGGGYHFFAFTAFSICTSRVRSATMCFSRRFSSSSAFSLRASLTSIPPYLLRQR